MSTSSRVIKNTGYLYVKMGITMFVSLYSTRLILASLGASDFGLFNVVGGAIAMLGFLNSTLANATQRFMSYAEGEGYLEKKRSIFNVSVILHILIAVATIIILIAAMYPLFNGIFNIDEGRTKAAVIIYFSLVFSTVLTIINVPYDAVMNAHENMLYYSIVGIFESLLRLGIAFICVYTSKDKLIVYGILMACVPLITLTIMKIYCHRHYDECVLAPRKYWDGTLVKQIASFFGWNFLTAITSLFSIQGIGIVLNHFFGTVLNAAQGIAQQVNGAVSNFSVNMMKALNPVITKSAGAKNIAAMNRATIAGCKFSSLLTMFFAIPLSIEIHYVLSIWLKEVPAWASTFVVLQLIQGIILQMANSASTAIYAQGDIKNYAIWKSIMNSLPLFITWGAFKCGGGPVWLYIPMIIVWGLCGDFVIIYYAKKKCDLDVKKYYYSVLLPILGTAFLMLVCGIVPLLFMKEGILRLTLTCILSSFGMFVAGALFAVNKEEKQQLHAFINGYANQIFSKKKV
jgi:O-antigen/teichoic acid export membrane protein